MKNVLLFLVGLAALASPLPADDFGLSAGLDNGFGFSWRSWSETTGFQLTALPIVSNSGYFVSAGGKILTTFHDAEWTRFYGWAGAGVLATDFTWQVDGGAGIGLELIAWKHLVFDLEAGLGGGANEGQPNAGLRVQGGIAYRL